MIVYIANRGEIARRVIRSAKRLGVKAVVGYADCDSEMPFVREAHAAVPLGGDEAAQTYLNASKVIEAAKKLQATHIHPGYGFLSENASFVDAVTAAGLQFIGPSSKAMRLLGDKIGSRRFLKTLSVPLLPSYEGDDQSSDRLLKEAMNLGFPLLIKPSAGGGGKGMYKVTHKDEFLSSLESSKRLAKAAFNDDRVFLEKLVEPARHIEVQMLADQHGNIRVFGERECSLQRRHQKVFEESPCVFLPASVRARILEASQKLGKAAEYCSAGTVEWIWDGADGIYFLEVNARLQVEHPVTEMVWGVDLVEWQLRVAQGESIADLKAEAKGHSIEARLCAEDPAQGFLPSGGKIHRLRLPENVRTDFGYYEKNSVPPHFDSMLGKMIAFGSDRDAAMDRLQAALEQTVVFGPVTNRAYLIQILKDARVRQGLMSTNLLADIPFRFDSEAGLELIQKLERGEIAASELDEELDYESPWGRTLRPTQEIDFEDHGDLRYFHTRFADWTMPAPQRGLSSGVDSAPLDQGKFLKSPMPAKVVKVLVSPSEQIKAGQTVVVLEAMKMEHQIKASMDSKVSEVKVKEGDWVPHDAVLVCWEKS